MENLRNYIFFSNRHSQILISTSAFERKCQPHISYFLQVTRSNLETTQGWNGCHPGSKPSSRKDSIINLPTFKNISLKTNHPTIQPTIHHQPPQQQAASPSPASPHTHTHTTPWSHHPGRGEGPSWPIGSPCNNLSRLLAPRMAPTLLSSSQYPGRVPPSPSQWRCLWCLGWGRWGVLGWCWYVLIYECDMSQTRHSCKKCPWSIWHDTAEANFQLFPWKLSSLDCPGTSLYPQSFPSKIKNETNSCAQPGVLSNWWIQFWSHSSSWWDQKSRTWQMQQTSNLPHLSKLCSVE